MPPSTNGDRIALPLTREEAWVTHAALLDAGAAAVDAGDDAPVRDRAPGRSLLRRVDDAGDSPSASSACDSSRDV